MEATSKQMNQGQEHGDGQTSKHEGTEIDPAIPDDARVWIFPLAHPLSSAQLGVLTGALNVFLGEWNAHGAAVDGAYFVSHSRFLVVAADPNSAQVSGCSIDSLFKLVHSTLEKLQLEMADLSDVYYLDGRDVQQVSRAEFKQLASDGVVTPATQVFDTSIQTVAEFRANKWVVKRSDSWHERLV
jgi:hypothetical protein